MMRVASTRPKGPQIYMSDFQNVNPGMVRIDYSRADKYVYPEPPKLTFWQKLGRGLGRAVSFAGPIGAMVSAVTLGPLGIPVAAGLFGLSNLARDETTKAYAKDSVAQAAAQPKPGPLMMPGLFQNSFDAGAAATDFIAPTPLQPDISRTIIQRNDAQLAELQSFQML